MNLIGSIQYLGNSLARRSQHKGKPAHQNDKKKNQPDSPHSSEGSRLGKKLDINA